MEITVRHEVHLHLDHVAINLMTQIRNSVINLGNTIIDQGVRIMAIQDDVLATVSTLEATVGTTVVPLLTKIGTELDALSVALGQAIAAGAVGPAFLQPLKDRLDALNGALATSAASLATIGTRADDLLATPLADSFSDRAAFDAAVTPYVGGESVTLDVNDGAGSVQVHAPTPGNTVVLAYFLHSATGGIDKVGPAD